AVSNDGGLTFGNVHLVTSSTCVVTVVPGVSVPCFQCGGVIDEPSACIDPSTGSIWVWWRRSGAGLLQNGFWIQRLHYDADGTLHWDSNPIYVPIDVASL